jgi:hypothetical protein
MNNKIIYVEDITNDVIEQLRSEYAFNTDASLSVALDPVKYRELVTLRNNEALAGYDAYFGIIDSVIYNDKTDRYVIKHMYGSAKCTDDVAAFLLANAFGKQSSPTCNAVISKGEVNAVVLRYLSK